MQARLQAAGVRPISNIVDVTNYVLLELGQPMHAFDLARLAGGRDPRAHRACRANSSGRSTARCATLSPEMLVIADAERAVAVAGVMGGADSEVSGRTTTIVLESAYFNPLLRPPDQQEARPARPRPACASSAARIRGLPRHGDGSAPCALLETIGAGAARGTVVDCYPHRQRAAHAAPAPRQDRRPARRQRPRTPTSAASSTASASRSRDAADGWDVTRADAPRGRAARGRSHRGDGAPLRLRSAARDVSRR